MVFWTNTLLTYAAGRKPASLSGANPKSKRGPRWHRSSTCAPQSTLEASGWLLPTISSTARRVKPRASSVCVPQWSACECHGRKLKCEQQPKLRGSSGEDASLRGDVCRAALLWRPRATVRQTRANLDIRQAYCPPATLPPHNVCIMACYTRVYL
eukprot:3308328-Prymnesium_polylepis.2